MILNSTQTHDDILTILGAVLAPDTPNENVLSLERFDRIEFIMRLEDHFAVAIDDQTFEKFNQVPEIATYIELLKS